MTNLDSILKSRDITLLKKVHIVKAMVFPVVMYEKIPGEGNGKLQQYSYLQKSMDRGAWQATVQTVIYD